jgi:uncharacterized phiE125 gp8 family phage protein
MSWSVTTPPTEEPVSLEEARQHLRADAGSEDALIEALIQAAREHVEAVCERALMPQTWTERQAAFPLVLELRGGCVRSVTAVRYVDGNGEEQTLPTCAYITDPTTEPATVRPAYGTSWPTARTQHGAVSVEYAVGYTDAASVPAALRAAVLLIVGDLYANREATIDQKYVENRAVSRLMWPFKRVLP